MARHKSKSRSQTVKMEYVRSFRKNRRRHRRNPAENPFPVAGMVANRRHRRNPAQGTKILGFRLPPLKQVMYAGVGFVGVPVTESFINGFLPLSITSSVLGKYAVRIGSVIGLTWLSKNFLGSQAATLIGIGGGAYVLVSAVREFAPGVIPGLNAYTPAGRLAAYTLPASSRPLSGMGAAMRPVAVNRQARFARFGA